MCGKIGGGTSDYDFDCGATATCEGGYGGLHDLSGNVGMGELVRRVALTDGCRMRGGASSSDTSSLVCARGYDRERDFASPSLGFRCCAFADAGD